MSKTRSARMYQQGFTLAELLVALMLISILSLIVANFIADWLQTSSLTQTRATLLSNSQQALDAIGDDIRLSGGADQNNRWADNNAPGGQFGWQSNGSTLVLARIATTAQKEVIFSDASEYITEKDNVVYYVSAKKLYRRIIAADNPSSAAISTCPLAVATTACPADSKIAEDVTAFSIVYYDANDQVVAADEAQAVQLAITLSAVKGGEEATASYTTRMVFRNE